MKKKIKRKFNRLIERAAKAEQEAEYYRKRLLNIGSNMEVADVKDDHFITEVKWSVNTQTWGHYIEFDHQILYNSPDRDEIFQSMKKQLVEKIATGLLERNIVQFIVHDPKDDPFLRMGTLGAKLFVIPWEQMPHKRTVEIKQYIENSLNWDDEK